MSDLPEGPAGGAPGKFPARAPGGASEQGAPRSTGATAAPSAGKPARKPAGKAPAAEDGPKERDRDRPGLLGVLRARLAQVVWTAAVVCALFLAVGALLIALHANTANALVRFVLDVADALDLEVFSRRNGVFKMTGADAATENALANWGLAAIAYLVVGRVVDRVVRP